MATATVNTSRIAQDEWMNARLADTFRGASYDDEGISIRGMLLPVASPMYKINAKDKAKARSAEQSTLNSSIVSDELAHTGRDVVENQPASHSRCAGLVGKTS